MTIDVPGFQSITLTFDDATIEAGVQKTRDVYRRGEGPAVIVMSEIPGITPQVASFARTVADAGFSVYMPQLFGTPMRPLSPLAIAGTLSSVCIHREFSLLSADESSPIVEWLRALARHAHRECGGPGVGAVGMCLTGNFALGMMLRAPVIGAVLSQPSLPLGLTSRQREGLHASAEALAAAREKIANEGAGVLGLRFHGDPMCPGKRFARLRNELGEGFESIELAASTANPRANKPAHSVLTNHLIDEAGEPTRAALDRTLAFLKERLVPTERATV